MKTQDETSNRQTVKTETTTREHDKLPPYEVCEVRAFTVAEFFSLGEDEAQESKPVVKEVIRLRPFACEQQDL